MHFARLTNDVMKCNALAHHGVDIDITYRNATQITTLFSQKFFRGLVSHRRKSIKNPRPSRRPSLPSFLPSFLHFFSFLFPCVSLSNKGPSNNWCTIEQLVAVQPSKRKKREKRAKKRKRQDLQYLLILPKLLVQIFNSC